MGAPRQLRIGVHYEPSNVDPHLGAAELALQMTNGVFDTLVNKTADGAYRPGLAEGFSISEDHLTYTFHIRKDILFHDGTPFTAEAMKVSLDRAHNPDNRSQLAGGLLGSYRESRVVDDHCLEIVLDSPYALLLDALSQGWLAPVSLACAENAGSTFIQHPIGTGPFRFVRWDKADCLIIRRNEHYAWAPDCVENHGPPLLDEILFKFLPDDAARTAALLDGSVDMIFAANPAEAQNLRATHGLNVTTWPIRGVPVSLMMNIKRSPTSSLAVRQAISHALDVDALVHEVFHGEFTRAYGPVSQFTLGYEPGVENMYPHNPEKALHLLEQEGWLPGPGGIRTREGETLRVTFYALPVNFYPQFGAIVARQLALVGIGVDVELCTPPQWIQAGMQGLHNLIPQGKYASSSQLLGFVYHSRKSGMGAYGWSKRAAEDYPRIDTLIDEAENCLTPAEFMPLFAQVQMEVMRAALAVPLHCNATIVAARDSVIGLRFDAIGAYPLFHDTTFQQDEA